MRNKIENQFREWKENNTSHNQIKIKSKDFVNKLHKNDHIKLAKNLNIKTTTNIDELIMGLEIKYFNWLKDIHF